MSRWLALVVIVLAGLGCETRSPTATRSGEQRRAQVDLNRATRAELEALPAIGEAYAGKIIAGRPYDNKTQLVSRGILPETVYAKVAPFVIARQ